MVNKPRPFKVPADLHDIPTAVLALDSPLMLIPRRRKPSVGWNLGMGWLPLFETKEAEREAGDYACLHTHTHIYIYIYIFKSVNLSVFRSVYIFCVSVIKNTVQYQV